jgi:lipopolysaccharide/colanic/teichoic acid biosynthesis glycosyltransferase
MMKRLFDMSCSGAGLILFSPIFLILAVAIKYESNGPVFYRGVRVGRAGRTFRIFKFRSMVADAEKIGGPSTSNSDNRVTKTGSFIRRFKLDEFAQLINVFLGNMSLVGPRPEVKKYVDMYTEEEIIILAVRPGITDWASIWNSDEGRILAQSSDPDKAYEEIIRPTKLKLQMRYVRERSFFSDIKLIFYTIYRLFNAEFYPSELKDVPPLIKH